MDFTKQVGLSRIEGDRIVIEFRSRDAFGNDFGNDFGNGFGNDGEANPGAASGSESRRTRPVLSTARSELPVGRACPGRRVESAARAVVSPGRSWS
ncbi:hypothetical protein [Kitasatospora sp. NPDC048407]|uniref:hypothetical protein n=1 Tax=Kitasatospora sp. NPDC048407 TaxID=3364051 RepID=UPI003712F0E0